MLKFEIAGALVGVVFMSFIVGASWPSIKLYAAPHYMARR